ncbi:MAG: hypothetical protein WCF50_16785, partial [Pseudolabrys sp.]
MDLFVVPTLGFNLLYAFVIVRLDRRNLVWINVTTNPTAGWIARQLTEAFPWNEAPHEFRAGPLFRLAFLRCSLAFDIRFFRLPLFSHVMHPSRKSLPNSITLPNPHHFLHLRSIMVGF